MSNPDTTTIAPTPAEGSPAPAGGEAAPTPDSPFTLEGMDSADDLDLEVAPAIASEAPAGASPDGGAPVAPVVDPKVPPATPVAAAPMVPPTVAPVAPPATPSGATPPSSEPLTLEQVRDGLAKNKDVLIGHLATTTFALSKEESDALEIDAVAAIPKIMARVFYEASSAAVGQIQNLVPRLVENILASQGKANEAEGEFYKAYPMLNKSEHDGLVTQFARAFRAANPNLTRAEMIKLVGNAVVAHTGLTQAPAAASAPKPNGSSPPPFAPARPGARPVSSTPLPDPWSGMGQSFDE